VLRCLILYPHSMGEHNAAFTLIGVICLSPLSIALWLLKRRIQKFPPDISSRRGRMLRFGLSLGFISSLSLVLLFVLSRFWDPPGFGSVEAGNPVLSLLAWLGIICNLTALASCYLSRCKSGYISSAPLAINQVLWLLFWFIIDTAHGF
jgi:hypothetical protein